MHLQLQYFKTWNQKSNAISENIVCTKCNTRVLVGHHYCVPGTQLAQKSYKYAKIKTFEMTPKNILAGIQQFKYL